MKLNEIKTQWIVATVFFYKKIGFEVAHETKDGDVRVVFLKLRDLILETYENKEAALCDGAVDHIAFDVADIYAEMKRLEEEGFVLLNKEPKNGADNKLVCFLHPKGTNGVLIELCQEKKAI